MYEGLADLALLEEAWERIGREALCSTLNIDRNTVNLWRRRRHLSPERRAALLAIIAAHPTPQECEAQQRIRGMHETRRPPVRAGRVIRLAEHTPKQGA